MTTFNTGNPIGSAAAKDLYDNAENLDEFVNSQDKTEHPDRLGVPRKTWHGMEQDFQAFLLASGYQGLGDYAAGIEITARNQVIRADGELWRLSASVDLPYTTTGAGMPEGGAFVSVGDAVLRQELANPTQGGELVRVTTSTGEQTLAEALGSRMHLQDDSEGNSVFPFPDQLAQLDQLSAVPLRDADIIITAGPSGDYPSLNEAISAASRFKPKFKNGGVSIEVRLLSGYVMDEPVFVQGCDLSFIKISAEDAEVPIIRENLTLDVSGRFPAFGAREGGFLPVIGALFIMDDSGEGSLRDGIFVTNNSGVHVLNHCGVLNAGERGIHVANCSRAQARETIFTGAATLGARISNASYANLRLANFSNAGQHGIALNGAFVNFLDGVADNCGESAIFNQGSYCFAIGASGQNCMSVSGIGYTGAVETMQGGVTVAEGGDFRNSGVDGIVCREAVVSAGGSNPTRIVNVSGAGRYGVLSVTGRVVCKGVNAESTGFHSIFATTGGEIQAHNANARYSGGDAIRASSGSKVAAGGSDLRDATGRAILATDGSEVIAETALGQGAQGAQGCRFERGSRGNIRGANMQQGGSPASNDITVSDGGIITAHGSNGNTNVTVNTLSGAGIIFR